MKSYIKIKGTKEDFPLKKRIKSVIYFAKAASTNNQN